MQGNTTQTAHADFGNQSTGFQATRELDACINDRGTGGMLFHAQSQAFGIGYQIGDQRRRERVDAGPVAGIEIAFAHDVFPENILLRE